MSDIDTTTSGAQLGGSVFVRLGPGCGLSYADQAKSLGLRVGDTIVGKEHYGGGSWSEAELTLLWMGSQICVWRHRWRNSRFPNIWNGGGEAANWSLTDRDWHKANAQGLAQMPAPKDSESITD
jgi:hypothetical protein